MRNKNKKKAKTKRVASASAAEQWNARGQWEVRRVNPPGVLHAFDFCWWNLFRIFITPAGVRRIQSLRAFRRPHLDAWMLGCFEDWSIGRIGRIRGTGWIGRVGRIGGEDREVWGDRKDWEDWEIGWVNSIGKRFGIRDSGFGTEDSGLGTWDSGLGIRDSGFGTRDSGI